MDPAVSVIFCDRTRRYGPYFSSLADFTHTAFSEVWPVPDAVIAVICVPDDVWIYHPKHVEQFTEI
jgi:hypothetical protein